LELLFYTEVILNALLDAPSFLLLALSVLFVYRSTQVLCFSEAASAAIAGQVYFQASEIFGLPFIAALALAIVTSVVITRFTLRFIIRIAPTATVASLASLPFAVLLYVGASVLFGREQKIVSMELPFADFAGPISIGGMYFSSYSLALAIFAAATILMACLVGASLLQNTGRQRGEESDFATAAIAGTLTALFGVMAAYRFGDATSSVFELGGVPYMIAVLSGLAGVGWLIVVAVIFVAISTPISLAIGHFSVAALCTFAAITVFLRFAPGVTMRRSGDSVPSRRPAPSSAGMAPPPVLRSDIFRVGVIAIVLVLASSIMFGDYYQFMVLLIAPQLLMALAIYLVVAHRREIVLGWLAMTTSGGAAFAIAANFRDTVGLDAFAWSILAGAAAAAMMWALLDDRRPQFNLAISAFFDVFFGAGIFLMLSTFLGESEIVVPDAVVEVGGIFLEQNLVTAIALGVGVLLALASARLSPYGSLFGFSRLGVLIPGAIAGLSGALFVFQFQYFAAGMLGDEARGIVMLMAVLLGAVAGFKGVAIVAIGAGALDFLIGNMFRDIFDVYIPLSATIIAVAAIYMLRRFDIAWDD